MGLWMGSWIVCRDDVIFESVDPRGSIITVELQKKYTAKEILICQTEAGDV